MIKFIKTEIIGFGSILEPLEFYFKPGLNIIKGDNGEGKTTVFNAWYWCLTGDTLKPRCTINTWNHLQPAEYLGTKVTNTFAIGKDKYEIIRCNNYLGKVEGAKGGNRLILKKNGQLENHKGIRITQEAINKIIGYSPELLKNTLIFGQKLKRLIDESGTNKKEVLEEAFDMLFISDAQEKAKKIRDRLTKDYYPVKNKLDRLEEELKGKRELLEQAIENEETFESTKAESIAKLKKELSDERRSLDLKRELNTEADLKEIRRKKFEQERELKKLKPKEDEYYEVMTQVARESTQQENTQTNLDKKRKELKKASDNQKTKPEKCYACGTILNKASGKELEKHYKAEYDKVNKEFGKLELLNEQQKVSLMGSKRQLASLKEVMTSIATIKTKIEKLAKEESAASLALSGINQHELVVEKLINRIAEEENKKQKKKSPRIKLKIKKLKADIKPINKELRAINKEIAVNEWLIKDPLSNSGLKAFIFRDMIYRLNERMAHYSKYFGFRVEFEVNMDSSRKDIEAFIIQGSDNVIPYQDLSGGQSQFVAVIMAFALHDIVAIGSKATNILLMDEIFENLSRTNIEKVADIINSKLGSLSINLITHRNEFNPYNSRVIKVLSKGGLTYFQESS